MTKLLAYFPSPPQGVWHLGPLPIRAYALFIIAGIVAALLIGDRRWAARGGERGVIYDIALWTVPFGLIGGRLYHLATDWRTYWGPGGAGLGAAVRIWDGGLGIWGAVALGGVGAWIGCRRRGIPLPAFADALAPGIILAQAIGRLGNYFNQELYGRETTLPWGLEVFYRRDPTGYIDPHSLDGISTGQIAFVVQPTFLYELIWNLLIFAVLIYADRRFTLGHGRLFALYVAGYCVGRFCVELLRDDTATHIAGIRINSFTSTFVFIGAVVYLMAAPKGREDPETLRGNEYLEEEAQAESDAEPATVAATAAAGAGAAADAPAGPGEAADSDEIPTGEPGIEEPAADSAETVTEQQPAEAEAEEPEPEEESEEPEVEAAADEAATETVAADSGAEEADAADLEATELEADVEEPDELEAEEPEAKDEEPEAEEAEAEEPEAKDEEPEGEGEEPEAKDAEPEGEAEAEEPEPEEPEAEESETEEPETDEPESEEPEREPATETAPAQPETRRRWGSRLRNRLGR
ncbi:prolipoprotein diacylglyceryl transferase [Mycobacterium colombiense]|uniref:Phosphatidylglycerol--prolipoprotein diacylglyceryl transferase n=1 Tax=Mycobacterium colombiense TaxID=339268 RepID=A0A329KC00_9MYCO|nr:prolipoprotein diacylglyceryl transferase [Mycobacterium colombiense]RAU92450.1 prolipoprotein diacylglyceryl transferase [Mycobacterium colombiense]